MSKYILRMEDEPCDYEDGNKYYKCIDAPWWSCSKDMLNRLPKYNDEHDLWNAVKYLYQNEGIDFGWSAEEVLKKYQESTKKRPELYEEWTYEDGTKCVVMDKINDMMSVFTENGCIETCTTADLKEYTGRTFPQITEVLKAMRGEP